MVLFVNEPMVDDAVVVATIYTSLPSRTCRSRVQGSNSHNVMHHAARSARRQPTMQVARSVAFSTEYRPKRRPVIAFFTPRKTFCSRCTMTLTNDEDLESLLVSRANAGNKTIMKRPPQFVSFDDTIYEHSVWQDSRKDFAKKLVKRRFQEKITARRNNVDHLYRNLSMHPYCGCWFVDNRDTIMACSSSGTLDIIRLRGEVCNDNTSLECSLKLGSFPSSSWLFRHFDCRSFGRGQSIAVGMPTGDLQLYDTEYCKALSPSINPTTWWRKGRTNKLAEKKVHLAANHNSSFIRKGWTARRAMRRYQGNFASLQEQIDDPFLSTALPEVYQWDNLDCQPLQSIQCWDFWEHSAGNIQALHMGDPHDYFGVTLCDTRLRASQNAIFFSSEEKKDTMMDFKGGCFLSERVVATIQENLDRAVVCLWDLRNPKSSCSEILLPSYPRDVACPSSPYCSYDDLIPHKCQYLTRYTLSAVRGDTLLVSMLVTKKRQHFRQDFQVDTLRGSNIQCIERNYVGTSAPISAVCPEMDWVATFHESNFDIDELQAEELVPSSRKRKFEADPSKYYVELTDRLGTSTTLNHLSFNEDGSCLCGASIDGDVFVWKV